MRERSEESAGGGECKTGRSWEEQKTKKRKERERKQRIITKKRGGQIKQNRRNKDKEMKRKKNVRKEKRVIKKNIEAIKRRDTRKCGRPEERISAR